MPGLGAVVLTPYTAGTASDALERSLQAVEGVEAAAFADTILAGVFVQPELGAEDVASLPGEAVAALVEVTIEELSALA